MGSEAQPKYIYKILPLAPPEPFPAALPLSPLDAKDGFVHLSTAEQVLPTEQGTVTSSMTALMTFSFRFPKPQTYSSQNHRVFGW